MAGVRRSNPKSGIVPYNPVPNGAPAAGSDGSSKNPRDFSAYDGKKANGLAAYNGSDNGRYGAGPESYTKGSNNYAPGAGNYEPSAAPASDFGPTRREDFGSFTQSAPQRSQSGGGTAHGYPVINRAGDGGGYVAAPEPVSGWAGSEPTGPHQNGWLTNTGPANHQLDGSGKTFGNGGGGYGPRGYGGQDGSLSGSEKHHHHFYHTSHQHHPVPYNNTPYIKEQRKRRSRGAGALAAALIACWACTCCCHVPCGC